MNLDPRKAAGFTLTAFGLLATAIGPHGFSPYAWLAVATGICGVGMGISTPSSNNATLQLAPDHAASVAGLRGMFRQAGSITAESITADAQQLSCPVTAFPSCSNGTTSEPLFIEKSC